ncbi:hypothetical protein THII_0496 [Thioploca ingrica]|uniref:Transposase IS200-like domain-containing protein n=1 Tax=Thioploca ingrica TaxID=40754 RepID=A0A090AB63_9GAMM|nr:hypothetical protein THII_0496 [Thioploca ingrica]
MRDSQSLSHTKWDCKYHLVFIPKRRKKVIYGNLRRALGTIFSLVPKFHLGMPVCQALLGEVGPHAKQSFAGRHYQAELGSELSLAPGH